MLTYLKTWNLMRAFRLFMGVFIIAQGISNSDWGVAMMGGFFSLMPIFNIGCCGASGCEISPSSQKQYTKEVVFEEVKIPNREK